MNSQTARKTWGQFQEDTVENTTDRRFKVKVDHYRFKEGEGAVLEYSAEWWETFNLRFLERYFTYETWLSTAGLAAHALFPNLVNHYDLSVDEDGTGYLTINHNMDSVSPKSFQDNVITRLWKRRWEESQQ
jgi:hypothetical protein